MKSSPILLTVALAGLTLAATASAQTMPVHVWLASDSTALHQGDVPIRVKVESPGYLIVTQSLGRGIKVLFPKTPRGNTFVKPGVYELEDLGSVAHPELISSSGPVTVYAAWSSTPYDFTPVIQYGNWSTSEINSVRDISDPVRAATAFVRRVGDPSGLAWSATQIPAASPEYFARAGRSWGGGENYRDAFRYRVREVNPNYLPSCIGTGRGKWDGCYDRPDSFRDPRPAPPITPPSPSSRNDVRVQPILTPPSPPPAAPSSNQSASKIQH